MKIDVTNLEKHWSGGYHIGISAMVGVTFNKVTKVNDDELHFECDEGTVIFYHDQDCCEGVEINDITGDLQDLVGSPILKAEESTGDTPSDFKFPYEPDSYTWTFYKFATIKGYVDVRWLGTSNGYYSERVDIKFEEKK